MFKHIVRWHNIETQALCVHRAAMHFGAPKHISQLARYAAQIDNLNCARETREQHAIECLGLVCVRFFSGF